MPRLVVATPRLLLATAILGGIVGSTRTCAAQSAADNRIGSRNAVPTAVRDGAPGYNRPYKANGATNPNDESRAASSAAKSNGYKSNADRVLSPFAPPPVPRGATTRSRSAQGNDQVDRDPRRSLGTTRTPAQLGRNSLGGNSTPSLKPIPLDRSEGNRDPRSGSRGVRNFSPEPRAMQYDPRNPQRDPRAIKPESRPLPGTSRSQAPDDQRAREQLRAIQQQRIDREAAKWQSEQAKLKAAVPTSDIDRQQPPVDRQDSPSADPGDGPLLMAPSNATSSGPAR